jgi:hypothetical protein
LVEEAQQEYRLLYQVFGEFEEQVVRRDGLSSRFEMLQRSQCTLAEVVPSYRHRFHEGTLEGHRHVCILTVGMGALEDGVDSPGIRLQQWLLLQVSSGI